MTRIIAGTARGRRLQVPSRGTRPTSDRIREALFSSLDASVAVDGSWSDVVVLDLYAGTGALGLEALSRGAQRAYLVESGREAIRVLRANIAAVGTDAATVVPRRVGHVSGAPGGPAATLVLADPPYDVPADRLADELRQLAGHGWIAAGATVVVERPSRDDAVPLPEGWSTVRIRVYGETALWYGHVQGTGVGRGEERD